MVGTDRRPAARPAAAAPRPLRVLLACSGLGHVARGFETFAIDCHRALRGHAGLDMRLVWAARHERGSGEHRAPALRRDTRLARALGRAVRRDGYFTEQITHAAGLVPLLARLRPDVVYLSDWVLAGALGRWRTLSGQRFRLLLSNGAPGLGPFDWTIDHVQQLTPAMYDVALDAGERPDRHTQLPLGMEIPERLEVPGSAERAELRRRLGLPPKPLVLTVAALNRSHKRLDHVIEEVAAMPDPPHLAMLGQHDDETPGVLELARARLGSDGFTARTVAPAEVGLWYRAADAFVLGSEYEAFGRVLPEALSRGLPAVAHDSRWARYATGGHAALGDLTRPGELRVLLERTLADPPAEPQLRAAHAFVNERFGWDALRPRYAEMIRACATAPRPRFRWGR